MSATKDLDLVKAKPTKEFFISMLTRDVGVEAAILDLVHNCIDGIMRIGARDEWSEFRVKIEGSSASFTISDNCGGIPVSLAREYAFRFGRPEDARKLPGSIGAWGIGMKRALFRLGNCFRIESTAPHSRFVIEFDVQQWKELDEWDFAFTERQEELAQVPREDLGTTIEVSELHQGITSAFNRTSFWNGLKRELRNRLADSLRKGLRITVGGESLAHTTWELKRSDSLRPGYWHTKMNDSGAPVTVRLYAGILASDPRAAGWYVFCNGIMVLGADKSEITGWGEGNGQGVPRYHGQFALFRGYVFFDSPDPQRVPWNTTKTGVDADSSLYRGVRQKMVMQMRRVIDFLNDLDAERDREESTLREIVSDARRVQVANIVSVRDFDYDRSARKRARTVRVQYDMPVEQVQQAKKRLKVNSASEVGRQTFQYFYQRECRD